MELSLPVKVIDETNCSTQNFSGSCSPNQNVVSKIVKFTLHSASYDNSSSNTASNCKILNSSVLKIKITDPADPFFFFSTQYDESTFSQLKMCQGLLVNFDTFPNMIQQLANKCVEGTSFNNNDAKFSMVMNIKSSPRMGNGISGGPLFGIATTSSDDSNHQSVVTLTFNELSQFRHLTHLSLEMVKATESEVKSHMVSVLADVKSELNVTKQRLESQMSDLQTQLQLSNAMLNDKNQQVKELESKLERDSVEWQTKLHEEMKSEKEQASRLVAQMQTRYECERKDLLDGHTKTQRQMENRVASLEFENRDLNEKKHKSEASLSRYVDQVSSLQNEVKHLRTELDHSKTDSDKMGMACKSNQNHMHQLQTKIALSEDERSKLRAELKHLEGVHSVEHDELISLRQECKDLRTLVQKRESSIRQISAELMKGSEVIQKFQSQALSQAKKISLSARVIEEQEKVMVEKNEELDKLRIEMQEAFVQKNTLTEKVDVISAEKEEMDEQMKAMQTKLNSNEVSLHWLNKQLAIAQARDPGLQVGLPPDTCSKFKSSMKMTSTPLSVENIPQQQQQQQLGDKKGLDERLLSGSVAGATKSRVAMQPLPLPSNVSRKGSGSVSARKSSSPGILRVGSCSTVSEKDSGFSSTTVGNQSQRRSVTQGNGGRTESTSNLQSVYFVN